METIYNDGNFLRKLRRCRPNHSLRLMPQGLGKPNADRNAAIQQIHFPSLRLMPKRRNGRNSDNEKSIKPTLTLYLRQGLMPPRRVSPPHDHLDIGR